MPDIFISYSRQNKSRVEPLAQALTEAGLTVWWDSQLLPGDKFRGVIQEKLQSADWVLVIWTKQSIESDWVKQEASKAHDRGVLIPVLFDDVTPPMPFEELQNADLKAWYGNSNNPEFRKIVSTIQQENTAAVTQASQLSKLRHWLKYHWKQLSLGTVFMTVLALAGGYNDITQILKGFFHNNGFNPVELDCALSTAQASSKTAPIFTAKLDRKRYQIGQAMQIELKPDRDAYFTIIDHGSDPSDPERKHVLFNNEDVQKDERFILPKPNNGRMEIQGPSGTNVFEVIASVTPIQDPAATSKNVVYRDFAKEPDAKIPETNNCTLSFAITN